jgi:hypothetical protein
MIIPLLTLVTAVSGMSVGWLLMRRPVPVPTAGWPPPPAQPTVWARSARELYRTVLGVVEDLDPAALGSPESPASPGGDVGGQVAVPDPLAVRAWVSGAIVRARGASTWARVLREQATGPDAETACARVAADLGALADAASAALVGPGDPALARVLDDRRQTARRDAERLARLL